MTVRASTLTEALLDRLAGLEPTEMPVVSVYLDARLDEMGREAFEPFLRKELRARAGSYPRRSLARESVETDAARILASVRHELPARTQSAVIYACSAAGLFEAEALDLPVGESSVYVGRWPEVYPLARLLEPSRRYAAIVADAHVARVFVFAEGGERSKRRPPALDDGWSQLRYQRHVDQRYLKHAKEAAAALARVVREEAIDHVLAGGHPAILPLIREELPPDLAAKVIDIERDIHGAEAEVLGERLEACRRLEVDDDVAYARCLLDSYRGGGLATVGVVATTAALDAGEVDELLLSAAPIGIDRTEDPTLDLPTTALPPQDLAGREILAGDLVARARRTGASVRFIDDVNLLWDVGGVGAFLRYRRVAALPTPPAIHIPDFDYEP